MKQLNEQELRAYAGKIPPQDGDTNYEPNIQNILNKALPDFRGEGQLPISTIEGSEEDNEEREEKPREKTKKALDAKSSRSESVPEGELEEIPEDGKEEKRRNTNWKEKAEKLEKDYQETRKWGQESSKRISSYKRAIKQAVEELDIADDVANVLLEGLDIVEMPSPTSSMKELVTRVWDTEIENIRKYGSYDQLDEHVKSLEHLLSVSTREEIDEIFEEALEVIEDDPVLFTKKLLIIGKDYFESTYKDYLEAGNLKGYKEKHEEEINKKDKTIDKLEKEIVKLKKRYEDYDESPTYRIPQGSGTHGGFDSSLLNSPGGLIEKFNQGKHRVAR